MGGSVESQVRLWDSSSFIYLFLFLGVCVFVWEGVVLDFVFFLFKIRVNDKLHPKV